MWIQDLIHCLNLALHSAAWFIPHLKSFCQHISGHHVGFGLKSGFSQPTRHALPIMSSSVFIKFEEATEEEEYVLIICQC